MPPDPDESEELLARLVAQLRWARALGISGRLVKRDLRRAPKRHGLDRRQDSADFLRLSDGRRVFLPAVDRFVPMMIEPPGESPYYGRFTDDVFQILSCGLEGVFLVELDEEDAESLRRAEDITHSFPASRDKGRRRRKPAGKADPDSPRKRLKPGEAALKIRAALDSLAAETKWNVAEWEIIGRAKVAKSTYYRLKRCDDEVKQAMEFYHDRRLGRGPLHAKDR
jgi:hypothetical protein